MMNVFCFLLASALGFASVSSNEIFVDNVPGIEESIQDNFIDVSENDFYDNVYSYSDIEFDSTDASMSSALYLASEEIVYIDLFNEIIHLLQLILSMQVIIFVYPIIFSSLRRLINHDRRN